MNTGNSGDTAEPQ